MTIWEFLRRRAGTPNSPDTKSPDPAETEPYRRHMAQAQEARDRAERILATYSEPKTITTRPA